MSIMVPWIYVYWSARDRNNTSWLGYSCVIGLALWALLKYCLWFFFLASRWLKTYSMLNWVDGLPECWIILLWRISLGEGIFGPIGVDCRSSRSLIDLPASWVVLRVVYRVLTYLLMNQLDWGKCGDEVVWSMGCHCRNCVISSDAKSLPESNIILLGIPYSAKIALHVNIRLSADRSSVFLMIGNLL